ncbi:glycosyl hydrolases family 18-domain-containing protein [Chytriomyces sp. MP71]|nr:glycosyl hydrolases family 18-domain-containing protein [Chytriomyces sp. MP71]
MHQLLAIAALLRLVDGMPMGAVTVTARPSSTAVTTNSSNHSSTANVGVNSNACDFGAWRCNAATETLQQCAYASRESQSQSQSQSQLAWIDLNHCGDIGMHCDAASFNCINKASTPSGLSQLNASAVSSSFTFRPFTSPGIVAYWTQWSIYSRKQNGLTSLDLSGVTALNYAFVNTDATGALVSFDAYADGLNIPILNGAIRLKYPKLRSIISIGGWSGSRHFSTIAASTSLRESFAKNVHTYLDTNGFDGVDIDWEYPGGGGVTCNDMNLNDAANFALLLAALRKELGSKRSISISVSPLVSRYSANGVSYVPKYLKYANYLQVMTYDFYGSWDSFSDFNSPLTEPSANASQSQPPENYASYKKSLSHTIAINDFIKAGAPASKLTNGLAFYGRAWAVQSAKHNGLFQLCVGGSSTKACPAITGDYLDATAWTDACGYTSHAATWMYLNLRGASTQQTNAPLTSGPTTASSGWTRKYFGFAQSPTLYHADTKTFISYDDPVSIQAKAAWAKKKGLGGTMIWEISQDFEGELIRAVKVGWGK